MQLYLGVNGKREGPYSLAEVEQKVREGSVPANALVWHAELPNWIPLADFLAAHGQANVPPSNVPPPLPTSRPQRTSGLAIASFILGVLGFCGISSLLGLIFGIVALRNINRSQGQLKGTGLAIAGICLSCVLGFVSLGLMLPALAKAKARAQQISCLNNMKELAYGLRMYANAHGDQFPPGDKWCDAILPYLRTTNVFVCPAHSGSVHCSYSLNSEVAGQSDSNPRLTLLFESEGGWNASGPTETMVSHHGSRYNICFADGSAQQVTEAAIKNKLNVP